MPRPVSFSPDSPPARWETRFQVSFCLVAVLAIAAPVVSHDLWVVPGKFLVQPGEKIRVFINSGDDFPASAARLSEQRIESFVVHSPSATDGPITGLVADGQSLTAEVAVLEPGTSMLAIALKPRLIRLKPEEFRQYLEEEGLPQFLKLREALGESNRPAAERYTKWAKAVLKVGEQEDDRWSKPMGLKLEIVPRTNPHVLHPGDKLTVAVFFDGKPLPDVTVVGGRAGTPPDRVRVVTGSNGEASLVLEKPGRWYLRALHMIRLAADADAEWESFWTTMTFEVRT